MRLIVPLFLLSVLLFTAAPLRAQSPAANAGIITAAPATDTSSETLYEDPSAQSSITVTQILPNSSTSMMTFGNVKRIRVSHDILVIEWGTTATTLLPRQFVGSLTVNKRSEPNPK